MFHRQIVTSLRARPARMAPDPVPDMCERVRYPFALLAREPFFADLWIRKKYTSVGR